jgi:hypothetical protein
LRRLHRAPVGCRRGAGCNHSVSLLGRERRVDQKLHLGLHLVVADIDTARSALVKRGLEVGVITDVHGVKYAGFSDPDGNSWLLQEFPPELRQPGQSFYSEGGTVGFKPNLKK